MTLDGFVLLVIGKVPKSDHRYRVGHVIGRPDLIVFHRLSHEHNQSRTLSGVLRPRGLYDRYAVSNQV